MTFSCCISKFYTEYLPTPNSNYNNYTSYSCMICRFGLSNYKQGSNTTLNHPQYNLNINTSMEDLIKRTLHEAIPARYCLGHTLRLPYKQSPPMLQ